MSSTKLCLTSLLFLSACFSTTARPAQSGGGSSGLPCVQKLLPCAAYLKGPATPPPTCCDPLKDAIDKDVGCLCDLFNNQEILKNFNVTQGEALQMPKKCGVHADLTKCKASKKDAPPASPPASTPAPPAPKPPTPTPTTPTNTPTKSSSPSGGISTMNTVALLVSSGALYLTMSS